MDRRTDVQCRRYYKRSLQTQKICLPIHRKRGVRKQPMNQNQQQQKQHNNLPIIRGELEQRCDHGNGGERRWDTTGFNQEHPPTLDLRIFDWLNTLCYYLVIVIRLPVELSLVPLSGHVVLYTFICFISLSQLTCWLQLELKSTSQWEVV